MSTDLKINEEKKVNPTPRQTMCIEYNKNKPLLIEAGPGAGKTFVLIERIKHLLKNDADPASFVVITFTIKAAEELKNKLLMDDDISVKDINKMQISTIHSFCLKLLEGSPKANFKIYSDDHNEKKKLFVKKHIKELGFVNEAYASGGQLNAVISKYVVYSGFKVDDEGLIQYIEDIIENDENFEKYQDFINEEISKTGFFPYKKFKIYSKRKKWEPCKKSWYNARYLQTAKSYKDYLKFLNDDHITDFNFLQFDALDLLNKNPENPYENISGGPYTNILIDEFQDTDPIQYEIFKILMHESMKRGGSFTAVGDANQRIYGFRGSLTNYFEVMKTEFEKDIEVIRLDCNHRSTNEIIRLSESFINHQREGQGLNLNGYRKESKDSFFITNPPKERGSDEEKEIEQICEIIKFLIEERNLNYEDIAVLSRSVKTGSIKNLVNALESMEIPCQIKGFNDLEEKDEIQSLLFLFNYLIEDEREISVFAPLDIRGFIGCEFEQVFVDLSDETREIICKEWCKFEQKAIEIDDIMRKEIPNSRHQNSISKIYDKREDIYLKKLGSFIERPILSNENLKEYGITNEDDLEFFRKLNALKELVLDMPKSFELEDGLRMKNIRELFKVKYGWDEIPTIIDIFYKILEISNVLTPEVLNNPKYHDKIENIALITNTILNYENIVSEYDVAGFYRFINSNIGNYGTENKEEHGVQVMTVHKSKGLEFPVVFVLSLESAYGNKTGFPKIFKNPAEKDYINGKETFYTPPEFLEYKNLSIEEEEKAHNREEERIIYVAMTRAEDVLFLSCIEDAENEIFKPKIIHDLIEDNPDCIKLLDDLDCIPVEIKHKDVNPDEKIRLSYTTMNNFKECPLRFKMINDFGFNLSSDKSMAFGSVVHKALDEINKTSMERGISIDEIDEIIDSSFATNYEDDYDEKSIETIKDAIHYYWENYGSLKILDSEYPFDIVNDDLDYSLVGSIDLIYETENGNLGLVDYKVSGKLENIESYEKQLNIYKLALDQIKDGEYSDREIEELNIYSILGKKMIPLKVYDDKSILLDEIESVVKDMKKPEYENRVSEKCEKCKFKFVCGID